MAVYANNSRDAILAMERDRTGNYGNDFYEDDEYNECPVCGSHSPIRLYRNTFTDEIVGCEDCISEESPDF